jgi:hypothetical protein
MAWFRWSVGGRLYLAPGSSRYPARQAVYWFGADLLGRKPCQAGSRVPARQRASSMMTTGTPGDVDAFCTGSPSDWQGRLHTRHYPIGIQTS